MTVTYANEAASASKGVSPFLILLFRWKGSIYKLIWKDLIIYLVLYYAINLTYVYALKGASKIFFEDVVHYCQRYYTLIPLVFVLGFYVTNVMNRWWEQFKTIPSPDGVALFISAAIRDHSEQGRLIRRSIVRYACLSFAMTLSMISPKVKKRFPTMAHFVNAGLMTDDEKDIYETIDKEFPGYMKNWLPLDWAAHLVTKCRSEGVINNDAAVSNILQAINNFRASCGALLSFDWVSVPLVYTQVVTLAVYAYFATTILARQHIAGSDDFQFPILSIIEVFFYVGWLKVAETLINPFGEDDDDFELNYMIDRHLVVGYILVDKLPTKYPQLLKDQYWNTTAPDHLPHTNASDQIPEKAQVPSTDSIKMKKADKEIVAEDKNRSGKTSRQESFAQSIFHVDGSEPIEMEALNGALANDSHAVNIEVSRGPSFKRLDDAINECAEEDNEVAGGGGEGETCEKDINFETLKSERREQMKQKLLAAFELMKTETSGEVKNSLLDSLIDNSLNE